MIIIALSERISLSHSIVITCYVGGLYPYIWSCIGEPGVNISKSSLSLLTIYTMFTHSIHY